MKVVITSTYNIGNETGTAKVAERLSSELSRNNEVVYLCLGKKYQLKRVNENLKLLTVPSVIISGVSTPKITPNTVERIKKDLTEFSPDVIHSQNILFLDIIALVWAKENNVPFIVTFHSLPSEGIRYVFPKVVKGKVIKTINFKFTSGYINRFLKNVDLVIALNESVVKSIRKITTKTPVIIINNGLELNLFYKSKTKIPKNKVNFVFLGSYTDRKNQEYLIRAFGHLPNNYRLELYGNTESGRSYVKKLKKIIVERNIKNVKINGFLNQKGVYKALEKAHYLTSASIKEVQSLVIIEALASGIPIIALKNETVDEIVDGHNGVALPKNTTTRKFAKTLVKYVENTEKDYEKVSFYCRESVIKFDIESVTNEIIQAYKLAIKYKQSKKGDKNTHMQVYDLIPKSIENFFAKDKLIQKANKPYYLRFILSILITISAIVSSVFYITSKVKNRW